MARENRVVMYRKYRDGDLPDIQMKHSDLIAPLQALAQASSTGGFLHICNLWILLRKIVTYLVGRKFYFRGFSCC